ncbi:MAG: protein arginine kinase [Candidatus Caldatribacteriota bacterium]
MPDNNSKFWLENLARSSAEWINGCGPLSEVVVSSRIRLARNMEAVPFPHWAKEAELKNIYEMMQQLARENIIFKEFKLLLLDDFTPLERQFLVEKHLISLYQANGKHPYRGCLYNQEETACIMINEEDHLRIQYLLSGLQLKKIWESVNQIDNEIGKTVNYAFSEKEGYLTSCPTNVGTGMRASVMLHLPALVRLNRLNEILKAIAKIGYVVRGFYGEGTEVMGNLFQISNQITLGLSEEEIIDNLEKVSRQIIEQEEKARRDLLKDFKNYLEDQIWRAYGILSQARIISSAEAMELLSKLRLGVELKIVSQINLELINRLMLMLQPAYLQILAQKNLNTSERDIQRAKLIREKINPMNN